MADLPINQPSIHLKYEYTPKAMELIPPGAKSAHFTVPGTAPLPMRGDHLVVHLGEVEITVRVLRRKFELLPNMVILTMLVGDPQEELQ